MDTVPFRRSAIVLAIAAFLMPAPRARATGMVTREGGPDSSIVAASRAHAGPHHVRWHSGVELAYNATRFASDLPLAERKALAVVRMRERVPDTGPPDDVAIDWAFAVEAGVTHMGAFTRDRAEAGPAGWGAFDSVTQSVHASRFESIHTRLLGGPMMVTRQGLGRGADLAFTLWLSPFVSYGRLVDGSTSDDWRSVLLGISLRTGIDFGTRGWPIRVGVGVDRYDLTRSRTAGVYCLRLTSAVR